VCACAMLERGARDSARAKTSERERVRKQKSDLRRERGLEKRVVAEERHNYVHAHPCKCNLSHVKLCYTCAYTHFSSAVHLRYVVVIFVFLNAPPLKPRLEIHTHSYHTNKGNAQSMSIVIAINLSCERSMHCNRSFTGVCFSYTSGDRVNGAV